MPHEVTRILLTGAPQSGKTTLIRRLIDALRVHGVLVHGITTRELRIQGRRVGFMVEAIGGESAVMAHVSWTDGPQVGQYRVDIPAFERVAIPALEGEFPGRSVVVIDEIGQMELYSYRFTRAVLHLFEQDLPLIATVHVRPHPVTDSLKRWPGVTALTVAWETQEELLGRIIAQLLDAPD
jgi:nucleoside-triphosphatase